MGIPERPAACVEVEGNAPCGLGARGKVCAMTHSASAMVQRPRYCSSVAGDTTKGSTARGWTWASAMGRLWEIQ